MNSLLATILIIAVVILTSRNFILNLSLENLKDFPPFNFKSILGTLNPLSINEDNNKVDYSSILIHGIVLILSVLFITSLVSNECYEEDEKTKYSKSFRQFENYAFDRQRNNKLMNRYR